MREKYQSIITADGWVICAKCGHKLARTTPPVEGNGERNEQSKTAQKIEFKCHTCKALNELVINTVKEAED